MASELIIRNAKPSDAATILSLITELAIYEKAEHEVLATEETIKSSLFSEDSTAKAFVCENEQGKIIAYAIYFYNYSTWLAKKGLYLEDLYVAASERGKGVGKLLLLHLAKMAVEEGCGRFEWSVLDWNTPAIEFYESLGAKPQDEWTVYRLTESALRKLVS
ncbi:GNAT family N-acetyltransferase [Entomomonas asaccharolytica]|uniref:GNAT family N-acetyltransferase n=1 Tax=Entomomonas asaccharolytica TaxID=2785331 RepID=A0A974NF57_9GAMM|nr:GNAT family N-acetyltransferase [Entomomonas asaccharolytica]QQP85374.1 GNAT family N-acetyltransferase [Entomomonas asaccharolytica]